MSKKRTAARRFAGLLAPALIAVLLAGCGGGDDPTPTPVAAAPAAVAEQPAAAAVADAPAAAPVAEAPAAVSASGGGAMDDLMAAFQAQRNALPVRISFSDGNPETFLIEVESPTRAHMLLEDDMEIVIYDGAVYIKEAGEWTDDSPLAAIAQSMLRAYLPDNVDESFTSVASVEQIDDGEVNGEAVNVYRVVAIEDEDDVADNDEGALLFHVRKSDGMLVRMSTVADAAEQVAVDYEYDSSIRVEVPAL